MIAPNFPRRRPWPNGLGSSVRVGHYDVNRYADHARAPRFALPSGVAAVTFTTDRRWNGWPVLVTYTVTR